jgi:hypothetical protein
MLDPASLALFGTTAFVLAWMELFTALSLAVTRRLFVWGPRAEQG